MRPASWRASKLSIEHALRSGLNLSSGDPSPIQPETLASTGVAHGICYPACCTGIVGMRPGIGRVLAFNPQSRSSAACRCNGCGPGTARATCCGCASGAGGDPRRTSGTRGGSMHRCKAKGRRGLFGSRCQSTRGTGIHPHVEAALHKAARPGSGGLGGGSSRPASHDGHRLGLACAVACRRTAIRPAALT